MRELNVLVSSAGRRVSLVRLFRDALARMGVAGKVLACDITRLSSAFHAADAGFVVPRCTAPDFVPSLVRECKDRRIGLIVPTIDTELPVYAAARDLFQREGITVCISSPDAIRISGDKQSTHAWLTEQGFPTVRQTDVATAMAAPNEWRFPLIAKPKAGSASIGVRRLQNAKELEAAALEAGLVVQTLAPGIEHTVDFYVDRQGRCLATVPRKRFEVRAGEVSKAMTVRSEPLQALAQQLAEKLPEAFGALNVQVFWDEKTDAMNIIEINARFGGGFPLAARAGAPFPEWLIGHALNLPAPTPVTDWKERLVMLRYDEAVFVDESKVIA